MPQMELRPEDQDSIDAAIRRWPHSVAQGGLKLGAQYFRSLHLDEMGRVFVRTGMSDEETDQMFDMFDVQGRYLGQIEAAVAFETRPRILFRHGAVYGVTLDSLDVPYVVRARLEVPPHSN